MFKVLFLYFLSFFLFLFFALFTGSPFTIEWKHGQGFIKYFFLCNHLIFLKMLMFFSSNENSSHPRGEIMLSSRAHDKPCSFSFQTLLSVNP